eukprot:4884266-Pyramimonas_sp.AAC.1
MAPKVCVTQCDTLCNTYVITRSLALTNVALTSSARGHCPEFLYTLIMAPKVKESGTRSPARISSKCRAAASHRPARSHADSSEL